jgi:hypothetical protein
MKKLILSILFLGIIGYNSWSQDLLGFENISGNDRIDYKNAESKALECAKNLLNTPIDAPKEEREKAITYMLMWMEGTPDYVFYIDEKISNYTRSNKNLMAQYLACLTKISLENPTLANDRNEIKVKAVEQFIDYCTNPVNHVKPYRQLDKLIKVRNKGQLKTYCN